MQPNEEQLELALDLYRAGVDQPTHLLLTTAHNLVSEGWTKGTALSNPIEAVYPTASDVPESPLPVPAPSTVERWKPISSDRKVTAGGIQWGTHWIDPNNIEVPERGAPRRWSGWHGLNPNQRWVMSAFCGDKGRYTLGVQAVINYVKKHPGPKGNRKWVKPHYLMHSLSRRGLIQEIDRDVWVLSPRGQAYVREILRMEPTAKHTSVEAVS